MLPVDLLVHIHHICTYFPAVLRFTKLHLPLSDLSTYRWFYLHLAMRTKEVWPPFSMDNCQRLCCSSWRFEGGSLTLLLERPRSQRPAPSQDVLRRGFVLLFVIVTWVWVNTYRYIFSGMNIHKSQLFWGSLGTRVLTHPHLSFRILDKEMDGETSRSRDYCNTLRSTRKLGPSRD